MEGCAAAVNSSYFITLHLHRSASLILSLFSLMLDAGIPDIALEPDKTLQKVCELYPVCTFVFLCVRVCNMCIYVCVYIRSRKSSALS